MTLERDVMVGPETGPAPDEVQTLPPVEGRLRTLGASAFDDAGAFEAPVGRVATFRFMRLVLRRRRMVWIALAVLGLVVGVALSALFPPKYLATATLYLAHPTGVDGAVAAQNDLAMLDTVAVGQRALAHLGIRHLTPMQLLGKTPGQVTSPDVLTISISGPSARQAIDRVDAVAHAYLSFRAQQYDAQNRAVVASARVEIAQLTAKVKGLTARIDALQATTGAGQKLTALLDQRAAATAQITTLQQASQQRAVDSLLVAKGSRVITPGTIVPKSRTLSALRNVLIGLLAGLVAGVGGVLVYDVLSDRVRRREEVAAVLASPVGLSVPRRSWGRFRRHSSAAMAADPPVAVRMVVQHLRRSLLASGDPATALVVAVGDARIPAAAMAVLCRTLSAAGDEVVVVDASDRRVLARALDSAASGTRPIDVGGAAGTTLVVPRAPWEEGAEGWQQATSGPSGAGVHLVLATLDLGFGATHLRTWSSEAIVTVRAGGSTAERLDAVSRLLRAAGITVASSVLLDAEETDESVGIPEGGFAAAARPVAPFTAAIQP